MAEIKRRDFIEFDPDEIAVLLKCVGHHAPKDVTEWGLSVEAFDRVWAAITEVAYAPMRESAP
jgi:hypothetical protein